MLLKYIKYVLISCYLWIIGVHNGVQALILEKQPLALYTHYFSHGLNLAISKACEIPAIRNMFGKVSSVSVFLSSKCV